MKSRHLSVYTLTPMLVVSVVLFTGLTPQAVQAKDAREPEVKVFEVTKKGKKIQKQKSFNAFAAATRNGGQVATGNVDGKPGDEIIVGAGAGEKPFVKVFTKNGKLISEFYAYDKGMTRGVNVAVGDLNHDGKEEIVTGTGYGASPQVRTFTYKGKITVNKGFFVFDKKSKTGVNVAVGNTRGNANEEIIVATGSGVKPRVDTYTAKGKKVGKRIAPFADTDKGGVSVAAANVDGGEYTEIATAIHSFGQPRVKVYKADESQRVLGNFLAYSKNFRGGVNIAAGDLDGDGVDEIVTAPRGDGGPQVRAFKGHGKIVNTGLTAYEKDFRGGVTLAVGNVDADSKPELITMPQRKLVEGRTDYYEYIDIDISEQRLRAYRNGVLENTFLISSGVAKYPTPQGTFHVLRKILKKDYKWEYGPGHPDNYNIKDVPYNLQFASTYYLHDAFWHNNFGHPMSHGCVNIKLENAKWIYEFAHVGDPVLIHP